MYRGSVIRAAVVLVLVTASACGAWSARPVIPSRPPAPSPAPLADTGVSLAANVGTVLVVMSLDPADVGENSLRVDLRDALGADIAGRARVDLALDGSRSGSTELSGDDRVGALKIPRSAHATLDVTVASGASAGATARFELDVPAAPASKDALARIDGAMQRLHTLREAQTLSGGGPRLLLDLEYLAPDRVRYTSVTASGRIDETRIIGRDRYDREGQGPWARSDLGFASRVPSTGYARGATRVRVVGHAREGDADLIEIAFVQAPAVYYRAWVGSRDDLVRRYTMMARGHYMTGTFSAYDAPLAIAPP